MSTVINNHAAFAARTADAGAQAIAFSRGHYLTTVALRVLALVIVPVAFWSSILAIIF